MDILRNLPEGAFKVVGKRCDRCRREVRAFRSMEEEFAMYEYVRVEVNAGYGADYFSDGDSWAADLCEACIYETLAPYLRLVRSAEERDLQCLEIRDTTGIPPGWLDELRQAVAERRTKPRRH